MSKDAGFNDEGYANGTHVPTRTLTQRFDREGGLEAAHRRGKRCEYELEPEYEGMWNGFRVQQVLDGGKRFVIEGWPTPIRAGARTELPPDPGKPTYGPKAREEARRLLREAKRAKVNLLGWSTKRNLFKVIHGERPLSYSLWDGTQAYVRRVSSEREKERDLRERPMAVDLRGLLAHEGTGLVWRR